MPITPVANVVIVMIAPDGTVSTTGPFISEQRANSWLTKHPEYSAGEGFANTVSRMDDPE